MQLRNQSKIRNLNSKISGWTAADVDERQPQKMRMLAAGVLSF